MKSDQKNTKNSSPHRYDIEANPFSIRVWPAQSIEFALVLSGKTEHILVGERSSIAAQLRTDYPSDTSLSGYNPPLSEIDFEEDKKILSNIHTVTNVLIESLVSDLQNALKKQQIKQQLNISAALPLICNCKFELGHFLQNFEYDDSQTWNQIITLLSIALAKKSKQKEEAAVQLLLHKWNSGDPICKYTALRIWCNYLAGDPNFVFHSETLTRPFTIPVPQEITTSTQTISVRHPILRLPTQINSEDERMILWVPSGTTVECIVLGNSFIPLKHYYRNYLNRNGYHYCYCRMCGRTFLSDTLKRKFCSEGCAAIQRRITKKEYDEATRKDALDVVVQRHMQFWRNRINKARSITDFPQDLLQRVEQAFEQYKVDAKEQKRLAKQNNEISPAEFFYNWAYQQENIIRNLMAEYENPSRRKRD